MPELLPNDHEGHWVARPSHPSALQRGSGHPVQPGHGAPQLPSTNPSPAVGRGAAGSWAQGLPKDVSWMRGNSHVQFLGEGVVVTPPPYPTHGTSAWRPHEYDQEQDNG